MATAKKQAPKPGTPAMDAVLARMLNTPPTPFTPTGKPAKRARSKGKPAK